MRSYLLIAGLFIISSMSKPTNATKTLFNFTKTSDVNDWQEISDTVREVGMSKAVMSLQRTQVFQRAVFFTLLNPQPNGAGFAGVRSFGNWDLRGFEGFRIRCRGQGQNSHYKIVLRHKGLASNNDIEYEQLFDAPMSSNAFSDVELKLEDFKPYWRGREVKDAEPLDLEHVTAFGFQVYGGVYMSIKQSGVSALEIETVEVF